MRLSAKAEYACIAMLELAARFGLGEPVRIREIADAHGVPARFLVQILLQLKGAGLVSSTRGAAGGYRLNRAPQEITLAEVLAVVEGPIEAPSSNVARASSTTRVLLETWRQVSEVQHDMLDAVTFADLVRRVEDHSENMYYI